MADTKPASTGVLSLISAWIVKHRTKSTLAALAALLTSFVTFTDNLSKVNTTLATLRGPKLTLRLEKFGPGLNSSDDVYLFIRPIGTTAHIQQLMSFIPRPGISEEHFLMEDTYTPKDLTISLLATDRDLRSLCYSNVRKKFSTVERGWYFCYGKLPIVLRTDFVVNELPETDWSLYEIDYVAAYHTKISDIPTNFVNFRIVRRLLPWESPKRLLMHELANSVLDIHPPLQ